MSKPKKDRLDAVVLARHPALSRSYVQSLILQGKVFVDGAPVTKPGVPTAMDAILVVQDEIPKFVSRAGFKMEGALDAFGIDVTGKIVLDAGISTGGFTDCLLQRGALRVYGVDVGYGIVHEKIRNDKRVILYEQTNLRYLDRLPEKVNLITLDLSFISLLKVMPAVAALASDDAIMITLIKPQFEADRGDVKRGGIVKDDAVHQKVIEKIKTGMIPFGFVFQQIIESPILGGTSGNKEFLALFYKIKHPASNV